MLRVWFPWQSSPRRKPKDQPLGLLQLYPPQHSEMNTTKHEIDIVAIHGLGGHRLKTFTSEGEMWLRDSLPKHRFTEPMNPRVSTFGYDASVAFGNSVSRIRDYARQLLSELHRTRRESKTTGVPIVIVATGSANVPTTSVGSARTRSR